jgi:hypothetical protein
VKAVPNPALLARPVQQPTHMDHEVSPRSSTDKDVHTFTVQRGMAVAVVIETPDWYSGLLQSALIRVRIEGQN